MDRQRDLPPVEGHPIEMPDEAEGEAHTPEANRTRKESAPPTSNPPHTTTGKVTAPKFGSAGSGGAELEPGPERD